MQGVNVEKVDWLLLTMFNSSDEDEDVKVFAIRMTAPTMLEVECAPISDPDFRMTITANDIDYGQIEFLTI